MKKKVIPIILALSLAAMGLTSCGGSEKAAETEKATEEAIESEAAESQAPETEAAETQAPQTEAPPAEITAESWIGTWTAVRVGASGAILTGQLENMDMNFTLVLNEDGSASMSMMDDAKDGSWEKGDGSAASLTLEDHTFAMEMGGNSQVQVVLEVDDQRMDVFLEKGTDPVRVPAFDPANAAAIKDASGLSGVWKASGLIMNGVCIEGNMDDFGGFDMQLELKDDGTGTVTMSGEPDEITWSLGDDGISLVEQDQSLSLKKLDDTRLILDFSVLFDGMYVILNK